MKIDIPKGNTKEDVKRRCDIIKAQLGKLKGKAFACPCLGGVPVYITGKGIDEISAHASKRYSSTIAAINIENLLKCAKYFKMHLPKNNGQRKRFNLIFLYELHAKSSDGSTIRLMVGVKENANFLQYSVTEI